MQNIDFLLNLDAKGAQRVLEALHKRGNDLFSKKGVELNLNTTGFNRSLDQAGSRILSFGATLTVISTASQAMRRLASDAITVESSIAKIQSILNTTQADLKNFTSSVFDLANETGTSFADAAGAAEEFARQGLSLEQTLKGTAAALRLTRVSGGDVKKTVQDLNALIASFGEEALVFDQVADVLGSLDAAFSTTVDGLASGLSRVSSTAQQAGVDFQTLAALIASIKQVSGRSENVIGNGLKSIFSNLGTADVQKEIENVGIATQNIDGSFRDAGDVIKDLAAAFDTLTDAQRNNLSLKIAGKYNRNTFESSLKAINSGVLDKALNVANNSTGSIADRLSVLNDTTETSIQRLQNSITELATTNFGGLAKSFIDELIKFGNQGVSVLKTIFEKGNPLGEALSSGLLGALTGPGILLAGGLLFKLVARVTKEIIEAGRSILGNNKNLNSQLATWQQITREIQKQQGLISGGKSTRRNIPKNDPFESNPVAGAATASARSQALKEAFRQKRLDEKNQKIAAAKFETDIRKQRRAQRFQNAAFGGAFAVSALGSAAGNSIGGSGGRVVDSVGQGASTAAIGLAIGGLAAPIGIAIGAFQILTTVTEELFGNFEDINKAAADNIAQISKESDAATAYIQAQEAYNQALKDGGAVLVNKTKNDLLAAGGNLTGNRRQLLNTSDVEEQLRINQGLDQTAEKLKSSTLALIEANNLVAASYEGTFAKIGEFLGEKKTIKASDAKAFASSILSSIDPKTIQNNLTGLQDRFVKSGDSSEIVSFVQNLVSGNVELRDAFGALEEKLKGASEEVAKSFIAQAAARKSNEDLINAQAELSKSSQQLKNDFKNITSRSFSQATLSGKSGLSGISDQISASRALDTSPDSELGRQRALQRDLLEAQVKSAANNLDASESFKNGVADFLKESSQGLGQQAAIGKFLEKINQPGFDLGKFNQTAQADLPFLGDNGIKRLKEEFESLQVAVSKNARELGEETKRRLASARIEDELARRRRTLGRFGNIDEDQSGLSRDVNAGQAAAQSLARFDAGASKNSNLGKIVKGVLVDRINSLTEEQADAIIKGNQSEQALGRSSTFSKDLINVANQRKLRAVSGRQSTSAVGGTISRLQSDNSFFNKQNGLQDSTSASQNERLRSQIEQAVQKGNFDAAQKLVSSLGLSNEDRGKVSTAIESERLRFNQIGDTATAKTVEQEIADNTEAIATNTAILASSDIFRSIGDGIGNIIKGISGVGPAANADIGRSSQIKDLGDQANIIRQDMIKKQTELNNISGQRVAAFNDKSRVEAFLRDSALTDLGDGQFNSSTLQEEKAKNAKGFNNSINRFFGREDAIPEVAGFGIKPNETPVVSTALSNFSTASEKLAYLVANLPFDRAIEIGNALKDQNLLGIKATDTSPLKEKENQINAEKNVDQSRVEALEKQKAELEKAGTDIKEGAKNIKEAAATFGQGSTQQVNANLSVDVTGSVLQGTEFNNNLAAFIRTEFARLTKEMTGKDPALLPVEGTTATA